MTPTIIVGIGLPGSGKSTVLHELAIKAGAVLLCSDELRKSMFRTPTYSHDESAVLFTAMHRMAQVCLQHGKHVIVDSTNLTESARQAWWNMCLEQDSFIEYVLFSAPQEVILERLRNRAADPHPNDSSDAGEEVYFKLLDSYEHPTHPFTRVYTHLELPDLSYLL